MFLDAQLLMKKDTCDPFRGALDYIKKTDEN